MATCTVEVTYMFGECTLKLLIFAEKIILFENQRQFLNSFNLVSANTFAAKLLLSGVPTQGI